jgi:glutamate-1-semialdehyde 2,1-aminomutase
LGERRQVKDKNVRASEKSRDLWHHALQLFPGGVSHNLRTFGLDRLGAYPPFMAKGRGPHIWDVDGNRYVDWWMTHFSMILGHNNPRVRRAIQSKLADGTHLGTLSEEEVVFGDKLQRAIPYLKKMRFCTTGSEATMYAVRLARSFAQKPLVGKARGGWHGGNDALGYYIKYPFSDAPLYDGVSFEFNDTGSVDTMMKQHGRELAAVVIEPMLGAGGAIPPDRDFLPYIREETQSRDILLIFDEIITGFRLRFGAAGKEIYGVEPDLLTLGKIVAGGMPMGVYGGREDVMSLAAPGAPGGCWVGGGTFSCHPLSMVAGMATLEELRARRDQYRALNARGDKFRQQVNRLFESEEQTAIATGTGSIVFLHWLQHTLDDGPITGGKLGAATDNVRMSRLQALLLEQGVFGYHGLGGLSFAHGSVDLRETLSALESVVKDVKT